MWAYSMHTLHSLLKLLFLPILDFFSFLQNAKLGSLSYQQLVTGWVIKKDKTDMTFNKCEPHQCGASECFDACLFLAGGTRICVVARKKRPSVFVLVLQFLLIHYFFSNCSLFFLLKTIAVVFILCHINQFSWKLLYLEVYFTWEEN